MAFGGTCELQCWRRFRLYCLSSIHLVISVAVGDTPGHERPTETLLETLEATLVVERPEHLCLSVLREVGEFRGLGLEQCLYV
jgi:hypothetical protein